MSWVCVSGYFDPFHVGHLEYLEKAKEIGDKLVVIVNSDEQAVLKKGKFFMPAAERCKIIAALSCVDMVVESIDKDRTVCETLRTMEPKPDFFCNGGDQNNNTIPEGSVCQERGIELRDGFGDKIQSSSWLTGRAERPVEQPTALITGITGQDGSYLAEFLLEKGYIVHGIIRRQSAIHTPRINHIYDRLSLHYGDLTDSSSLIGVLSKIKASNPERLEVYNLGAQSHVKVSFELPEYTAETSGVGTLKLLEAIRTTNLADKTRFYQASTSEMFGLVQENPQRETTPFYPRSPYGCAKLYAHWIVKNYRESYGMHASSGILFNHESPRRGETFVTRKITRQFASIKAGVGKELILGNLDAKRDWGHARDFVKAMWLMLQQDTPDDYVIATGEQYSVRDFVNKAAEHFEWQLTWSGEGVNEIATDQYGRVLVRVSERYFRPAEVETLLGDASKAMEKLGWQLETSFDELVREMCVGDTWTSHEIVMRRKN